MKLNPNVIGHASEIYTATIAAHHRRGLPDGERLTFQVIAGESVEAAIRFAEALEAEEQHGSITRVMRLNDAQRAGYMVAMNGGENVRPEGYTDEEATEFERGHARGTEVRDAHKF